MALDVAAIDRAIAKLQELRKLASDPDVAPFFRNGNAVAKKQETTAYDTELGNAVITACAEIGKVFTVNDVLKKMGSSYQFRGAEPRKSVANVLRALARDGHVKITQAGKGRRQTIYV